MKPQNWEISLGGLVLASQIILNVVPEEIDNYIVKVIDVVTCEESSTANELRKRGWKILGDFYIKISKVSLRNHFTPMVNAWVRDYNSRLTNDFPL